MESCVPTNGLDVADPDSQQSRNPQFMAWKDMEMQGMAKNLASMMHPKITAFMSAERKSEIAGYKIAMERDIYNDLNSRGYTTVECDNGESMKIKFEVERIVPNAEDEEGSDSSESRPVQPMPSFDQIWEEFAAEAIRASMEAALEQRFALQEQLQEQLDEPAPGQQMDDRTNPSPRQCTASTSSPQGQPESEPARGRTKSLFHGIPRKH